MKRSNLILLTVLMLAWATLPLIAASNPLVKQILKLQPQADKDGDGKLSKAEEAALIKMILRRFPRADANGDGALSDAEKLRLLERGEARMKQRTDAGRASASSPMTNNSTTSGLIKAKVLQSHGITVEQLDSLAEIMSEAVKDKQVAGVSFVVVHKGEVVYREGFGYADIESRRPFTAEELLPIASVSKPFMASVVMAQVDQGKLKLDDLVEKYLPEFKGKRVQGGKKPAKPMTIRQLISHTGGFWGNKGITPEKMDLIRNFKRPLNETINLVAKYDLAYEPGTKWVYSGVGYCVLGRVLEVALGKSLEVISQETLFRPLGLSNTTFLPSREMRKMVPTAYLRVGKQLKARSSLAEIDELRFILPGGSLFTNLDALAAFGQMHLNDGFFNGKRILSEKSVTEMRKLQSSVRPGRTYGLGWFRDDVSELGLAGQTFHGGALGAHLRIDRRRKLVWAFLVHQNGPQVQPLKDKLVDQVNKMFPVLNDH
jgi:CubicO group peptidase (beta-lactamase class C family)